MASLLYIGPEPRYRGFQLDFVVEVVSPGNSRYRFIRSIRALFEHKRFHYQQPDYPFGYVFWVVEARDKSLKVRGSDEMDILSFPVHLALSGRAPGP